MSIPGYLETTLTQLCTRAVLNPGKRQSHRFTGGLIIWTAVLEPGKLNLALTRASVWPSVAEWQAAIERLPSWVQKPTAAPERHINSGGRHLRAETTYNTAAR